MFISLAFRSFTCSFCLISALCLYQDHIFAEWRYHNRLYSDHSLVLATRYDFSNPFRAEHRLLQHALVKTLHLRDSGLKLFQTFENNSSARSHR